MTSRQAHVEPCRATHSSAAGAMVAVAILALAAASSCSKKETPVTEKDPHPQVSEDKLKGVARTNLDSPNPTAAQLERKRKSTTIVQQLGLPTLDRLPVVEDEVTVTPRSKDEVASRCVATAICAVKGESNDQALIDQLVQKYSAKSFFSPEERKFIEDRNPSKQSLADFGWRYECVHVFLWALGYLPGLNPPDRIADVAKEAAILRDKGPEGFTKDAKLRPMAEILDQNDLYYRLHWAVIDLRLKNRASDKANEEIIMERHRALNWLVRYMNQAWDDVTTDT
jgi:hypothetical protein